MILHYAAGSAHSAAVRIALAEKGIEAEERRVDLARFAQFAPEFLALGTEGTVPVLEWEGQAMGESFALMLFLDETFPAQPLGGSDPQVREWGEYVDTQIAPNLAVVRWQALKGRVPEGAREAIERLPPARCDLWRQAAAGFEPDRIARAAQALLAVGARLGAELERRPWLAGDEFTLADIAVFPHVAQFLALGLPLPASAADWLDRVAARPSVEAIRGDLFPLATMGPQAAR